MADALGAAGWDYVWREARNHYCMRANDGSAITYLDGDIYVGDRQPRGAD